MNKDDINQDWIRLIKELKSSSLSAAEFCRIRGIHPNTFYTRRKFMLENGKNIDDFIEIKMPEKRNQIFLGTKIKIGQIEIYPDKTWYYRYEKIHKWFSFNYPTENET